MARPGADGGAEGLSRRPDPRADRRRRSPRGRHGCRRDLRRGLARADDGLDGGRHHPPGAGPPEPEQPARDSPAGGCRSPGSRAVRVRPAGAHRCGAGLEGAQVGEAEPALRSDRRECRASLPGRAAARRGRRAGRQGLADQAVRQAGRRGDLQGPRPQEDRGREAAPRRARHRRDPDDRVRGRRLAAHARLCALPARPDADHDAAHARHRQGGPADRRPLAGVGSPVHAPLQLPAVLGRRDRIHAGAEAPRHRPRCARAAGAPADDPACGGLPLHDPSRLRDARVERIVVDGLGLRLDARSDGRGCPDQGAGQRDRDGSRQGRRRLRDPDRHPGRRGPSRRHGLQGRRHAWRRDRAADGHQDHRRHPADHAGGARAGEAGPRVHPRQDDARRCPSRAPSSRTTPRGSRR